MALEIVELTELADEGGAPLSTAVLGPTVVTGPPKSAAPPPSWWADALLDD